MDQLNKITEKYATFEMEVWKVTNQLYNQACSSCACICCKPDLCVESLESPFLKYLLNIFPPSAAYNKKNGWLTSQGCILAVGRPPVCHEFLCNHIIDKLPDNRHRYVVTVLSYLVTHIGKMALGPKHIVEITNMDALKRINADRFDKRLFQAKQGLREVIRFFETNSLDSSSLDILSKICPLPGSLPKQGVPASR